MTPTPAEDSLLLTLKFKATWRCWTLALFVSISNGISSSGGGVGGGGDGGGAASGGDAETFSSRARSSEFLVCNQRNACCFIAIRKVVSITLSLSLPVSLSLTPFSY